MANPSAGAPGSSGYGYSAPGAPGGGGYFPAGHGEVKKDKKDKKSGHGKVLLAGAGGVAAGAVLASALRRSPMFPVFYPRI